MADPIVENAIDRTGETLTPAQASAQQKEEEKQPETPVVPPATVPPVVPTEEKKPEETPVVPPVTPPEEVPPVDPPAPPITKPRTIYDDLKEKKVAVREAKAEADDLREQLAEKNTLIVELTEKAKIAQTPEEKQEVADDIKAIAEEIGASPEGITKLTDFITKKVGAKPVETVAPLSPEERQALQIVQDNQTKATAEANFKIEFADFTPKLKEEFPAMPDTDLPIVSAELNRLAHTQAYADKPLGYILWENKAKLAKLISPKRASLDGGNPPAPQDPIAPPEQDYSEGVTPAALSKSADKGTAGIEIRRSS